MRIVAVGGGGRHGFSFEPAGLKTSSAPVVAGGATKQHCRSRAGVGPVFPPCAALADHDRVHAGARMHFRLAVRARRRVCGRRRPSRGL
jgi:hypothetical protein